MVIFIFELQLFYYHCYYYYHCSVRKIANKASEVEIGEGPERFLSIGER